MIDRIYGQQPLRLHSLQGYVSDPANHYAQRGKASFLISAVAAAVIAAAPAVVNFFEGIGSGVH
jgi:hypothetical protein